MADFEQAFRRTLGFEDSPTHPGIVTSEPRGGKARLGINSNAHPEVSESFWTAPYDVALETARTIYRRDYWVPLNLGSLSSQDVADKVYDMAVNMGVGTAARLFQKALGVKEDGHVGPKTIEAANHTDTGIVLTFLRVACVENYQRIATSNPSEYGRWEAAWIARAER